MSTRISNIITTIMCTVTLFLFLLYFWAEGAVLLHHVHGQESCINS